MGFLFGSQLFLQVGDGVGKMEVAGVGDGECVGGVEVFGGLLETEDRLKDGGYLLFGSVAVTGDMLFDDRGFIFGDGEVAGDGSSDGYALGTAKFEHGLNVFAEEGCFDGEVVGVEGVDEAGGGEEYLSYAEVEFRYFLKVKDIHGDDVGSGAVGVKDGVSENLGAWIDAEDEHILLEVKASLVLLQ